MKIIRTKEQLAEAKEELAELKKAKSKILGGGQSYSIGSNQLNRVSYKQLTQEIEEYEKAIDAFENYGSTKRRCKTVIPR